MNNVKISRRLFCSDILRNGMMLIGAEAVLAGCGGNGKSADVEEKPVEEAPVAEKPSGDPCSDFSNIEPSEVEKRNALGYVEKSPIPDNMCKNCKLFVPERPGSKCGGCQLFKGAVFLDAYCTYWADPEI